MSIDIDWATLTGGSDGAALAESIRAFVHERFQRVTLPRFISSVEVHSFDFGTIAPDVELKDVCDPLPDFYDEDDESDTDSGDDGHNEHEGRHVDEDLSKRSAAEGIRDSVTMPPPSLPKVPSAGFQAERPSLNIATLRSLQQAQWPSQQSPIPSQVSTPGIPRGTSNFSYFHMQPLSASNLASMRSGQSTPSSAMAPHHFGAGGLAFPHHHHIHQGERKNTPSSGPLPNDSMSPPSVPAPSSQPEPSAEDIQTIFHLRYAGDLSLRLTADILLDYPTTSFVSIPLQLNVTGLSFDGVAVLAYIKRRMHFCFLAPDDADALVGGSLEANVSQELSEPPAGEPHKSRSSAKDLDKIQTGSLFDSIHIDSEIGQRSGSKQSLKNIGKVEAFVLEQVRRLFEQEVVYPNFWTFLV